MNKFQKISIVEKLLLMLFLVLFAALNANDFDETEILMISEFAIVMITFEFLKRSALE